MANGREITPHHTTPQHCHTATHQQDCHHINSAHHFTTPSPLIPSHCVPRPLHQATAAATTQETFGPTHTYLPGCSCGVHAPHQNPSKHAPHPTHPITELMTFTDSKGDDRVGGSEERSAHRCGSSRVRILLLSRVPSVDCAVLSQAPNAVSHTSLQMCWS